MSRVNKILSVDELNARALDLGIDLSTISATTLGDQCDRLSRTIPYWSKDNCARYTVYAGGRVVATGIKKKSDAERCADECGGVVEKYVDEAELEAWQSHTTLMRRQHAAIETVFTNGLFYLTGTLGNPKAGRAYDKAYELGHSTGYLEIASTYLWLVDLIN